jgi:uncharacterized membrane protein YfcA
MLSTFIICLVAFGASLLTFYSGFGLGTILTPVFAIWFPIEVAVAMTGIVHFSNNVFKISLVRQFIDFKIGWKFGIPAIIASIIGAILLIYLPYQWTVYSVTNHSGVKDISLIKFVIAVLMIIFVLLEFIPQFRDKTFDADKMWIGGILSGFFGGLAGLQGVLRSMFLIKAGLSKEAYIATGIFIACLIDLSRIPVYFSSATIEIISDKITLTIAAVLFAFLGAYLGAKLLKKTVLKSVQMIVSVLLIFLASALLLGYI